MLGKRHRNDIAFAEWRQVAKNLHFTQHHRLGHNPRVMVPFRYCDFFDVPRLIILPYKGKFLFFQSAFDETLDEYPNVYSVYQLPESVEPLLAGSWLFLEHVTWTSLGEIPVSAVKFDSTNRKTLDPTILDPLLGR